MEKDVDEISDEQNTDLLSTMPTHPETEGVVPERISNKKVLSLVTVVCTPFLIGMVLGWSAVLPKMEDNPQEFEVGKQDVTWLVSFIPILGIATSLVAGSLMELLGPRRMILFAVFPMPGFWLMKAYAPYLGLLYVGRAGLAITTSLIATAIQPLVAELSPSNIRGLTSSFAEIIAALGVLASYILAHFLPWSLATAVSAIPCVPVFLMLLSVPESPYWLVKQTRNRQAENALRLLTETGGDHIEQLNSTTTASPVNKASLKYQTSQLKKSQNARPVTLLWFVFILRELGGKSLVFSYSVYLFRQAKVEMDPFVCTILIGIIRVIGNVVSALTTDQVGRKPFLISSSFVCGLSLGLTGLVLLLEMPGKSWMPLVLLLIFVGSFGIGLGPIPWLYVGELIPTPVRSLGASLITATYNLVVFALSYAFFKITEELHLGPTMLMLSLPNFVIIVIARLWLPETRGRSLQELEKAFNKTQ